jgi:hypothetical protein
LIQLIKNAKITLDFFFLFVSSDTIEFAKETSYDSESNNQFEFTYSGNGFVFVYVSCGTVNNLRVQYGIKLWNREINYA